MPLKIAFVDDSPVNQITFARKIQLFDDLELVFNASNCNDCLLKLEELQPDKLPQVLFVDLEMPPPNGIQVIQIAKAIYPQLYFIVLTVFDDDDRIFDAIKAGANGYLMKDENAHFLHQAIINCIEQNGAPMSPTIARKTIELLSKSKSKPESDNQSPSPISNLLTDREREILQQIINGLSPKQIAEKLFISVFTVRKHISNIYGKLHVKTNSQVLKIAHHNKWT